MNATSTPRIDLVEKLLRFALAPEAHETEAQNAAARMVTVARREGVGYDALASHLGALVKAEPKIDRVPDPVHPPAWEMCMPIGKYKGRELGQIALNDPRYLWWVYNNLDLDGWLRDAIDSVMAHVTGKAAA